jgi:hypothetical protein
LNERASNVCAIKFRHCTAHEFGSPEDRHDATARGIRVAEVHRGGKLAETLIATREQTRALLLAGATPADEDVDPDDDDDASEGRGRLVTMYQLHDEVEVAYHPGVCSHPDCATRPLFGKVVAVNPTPLDQSYTVRLACGAEPRCTAGMLRHRYRAVI